MDRRRRLFVSSALTYLNFLMCKSVRCTLPQHKSGSTAGFAARAQGSQRIGFAAADLGKLPDGVTAEMLWALPMSHFESAAQCVELMCSDLGFDDSWFRVMASLSPETPPPKSLNTFLPISCLTTLRMLLGCLWMQKNQPNCFHTAQTKPLTGFPTAKVPARQVAKMSVYSLSPFCAFG